MALGLAWRSIGVLSDPPALRGASHHLPYPAQRSIMPVGRALAVIDDYRFQVPPPSPSSGVVAMMVTKDREKRRRLPDRLRLQYHGPRPGPGVRARPGASSNGSAITIVG